MRPFFAAVALSALAFCASANAKQISECSKFEILKLNNQIDRMNHPTMLDNKCIAQEEIMKARNALDTEKMDLCMTHMQNALLTIHGNPPAGLTKVKECVE